MPPGVTGWVVKPVEIDDVPIVTLTLTGDGGQLRPAAGRRGGGPAALGACRACRGPYVVGGEPRTVRVDLDPERLQAYALGPLEVQRALQGANVTHPAGDFTRNDAVVRVEGGHGRRPARAAAGPGRRRLQGPPRLPQGRGDRARRPGEVASYVRHGWGPARGFEAPAGSPARRSATGAEISGESTSETGSRRPARRHAGDRQAEGDQRRGRRRVGPRGGRGACEPRRDPTATWSWSSPATPA